MPDAKTQQDKLREPFLETELEWRLFNVRVANYKPVADAFAYVSNRAIQNRLDEVFGICGWQNMFSSGPCGGVICGISALCRISDDEELRWVTKWDGAENPKDFEETVKGGLTSSMERAATQWGIGRYLYNFDFQPRFFQNYVEGCHVLRQGKNGKEVYYWMPPELPEWALPGGTGYAPEGWKNEAQPGFIKTNGAQNEAEPGPTNAKGAQKDLAFEKHDEIASLEELIRERVGVTTVAEANTFLKWVTEGEYTTVANYKASQEDAKTVRNMIIDRSSVIPIEEMLAEAKSK